MKWLKPLGLGLAVVVFAAACGGEGTWTVDEPAGEAMVPDLAPMPPIQLHTSRSEGVDELRFTSTLVNVGEGDFVLRGSRDDSSDRDAWAVDQEIRYSESGASLTPTAAEMVWGGDGHEHWHVRRVAEYRLVPLDESGEEVLAEAVVDTKIGFCFFDSDRMELGFGPRTAAFSQEQCGDEDHTKFRVGLSPGWGDVYSFALPGQSFDITNVPDGAYRIWAEADPRGWFTETDIDNNPTWADIELYSMADGFRQYNLIDVGPDPTVE